MLLGIGEFHKELMGIALNNPAHYSYKQASIGAPYNQLVNITPSPKLLLY
jgi:hypothetical protein